jgi:hypothetical protein
MSYVDERPPEQRYESPGTSPGAGYVWIVGRWEWRDHAYAWVPGKWSAPEPGYKQWVPGAWKHEKRGWFWVEGHWR